MSIDRAKFYSEIKKKGLFAKLSQAQVNGFEAIFNEWDLWLCNDWVDNDPRKLAYMLATTKHETADTMQAIKEYGGSAYFIKRYWTNVSVRNQLGNKSADDAVAYCGKGLVQLTGRANYAKMGKLLNYDLIKNPDLALDLKIAVEIMFEGMLTGKSFAGDFTGKHLGNYFNKSADDPINSRRIINGTDKAKLISTYHYKFLESLS